VPLQEQVELRPDVRAEAGVATVAVGVVGRTVAGQRAKTATHPPRPSPREDWPDTRRIHGTRLHPEVSPFIGALRSHVGPPSHKRPSRGAPRRGLRVCGPDPGQAAPHSAYIVACPGGARGIPLRIGDNVITGIAPTVFWTARHPASSVASRARVPCSEHPRRPPMEEMSRTTLRWVPSFRVHWGDSKRERYCRGFMSEATQESRSAPPLSVESNVVRRHRADWPRPADQARTRPGARCRTARKEEYRPCRPRRDTE